MKKHILLDIEALGTRPGSAIIELGAVAFIPESGALAETFEAIIEPQAPFTADLETLEWHRQKGTWPRPFAEGPVTGGTHSIGSALAEFEEWIRDCGEVEAFWAWGATYDFPLLAAGYDFAGFAAPWRYYETRCARTVWQLAFGDRRHDPRPHRGIEDAKAAAVDIMEAMSALQIPFRLPHGHLYDIEAGLSLEGNIRASMIAGEDLMSISLTPDHARRVGNRLLELAGKGGADA